MKVRWYRKTLNDKKNIMEVKIMRKYISLILAISLMLGKVVFSEHPSEHPSERPNKVGEEKKSHKHKTFEEAEKCPTCRIEIEKTRNEVSKAITSYINTDTNLKGGFFFVYDSKKEKVLALKLDKVHNDRLSKVSDNLFFACVDLKTVETKKCDACARGIKHEHPKPDTYDLDFFLKKVPDGSLQVTEISVHKENGIERYTWDFDGNNWSKKAK